VILPAMLLTLVLDWTARNKGAGARCKAENFSWEKVARQITSGYQRLLSGQAFAG
jgi:hypothetical protein